MSTLPGYVWATALIGLIGTIASICVMLWAGALGAGLARRVAALMAGGVAICWNGWVLVSAALARTDVYRFEPTKPLPLLPLALMGALVAALLFTRVPAVSRVLAQPGALMRLTVPHVFRMVAGVAFLFAMALGQLPAVFALPAGLGDVAIGVEAVFVARNLRRGRVGPALLWFNILGLADLVVALGTCYAASPAATRLLPAATRLLIATPTTQAISQLPLALIPTAMVPLAAALHLTSLRRLRATISGTALPPRWGPRNDADNSSPGQLLGHRLR
jgi:hypothetical protein